MAFFATSAPLMSQQSQPASLGSAGAAQPGQVPQANSARPPRDPGPLNGAQVGFIMHPVIDSVPPVLPSDLKSGGILIYSKTSGFRDEAGIEASDVALAVIAKERGWPYYITENAAIMNKEQLARFKVVVWNNNSGDTLTKEQREAFKTWIEEGGSYVGTHGAGGDPVRNGAGGRTSLADWPWYIETLLGAQFKSHAHIQAGDIHVEDPKSPLAKGLPPVFKRSDEWYSFTNNPRALPGVHVILTADEKSYNPDTSTMGTDHPMAWWHCVGKGRAFYSALGHGGLMYAEPVLIQLYENAMGWALTEGSHPCVVSK
jgi:type 1 glutamine amidotransferase